MSHLTEEQRYKIQVLLEQKSTIKTIAYNIPQNSDQ